MWCDVLFKLKQKEPQLKTTVAEHVASNQHTKCRKPNSTVSAVSTVSSCQLAENRKRKSSVDVYRDDDKPGKKLKFSSLFTNNPEIPDVTR